MKIKKIGHCCLIIEVKDLRVIIDPGDFSTAQSDEKNIDLILVTHEHSDHLHIASLKDVLKNNSAAVILTNSGVSKILSRENIAHKLLEDGQGITQKDVLIEAFGTEHAYIYETVPSVINTGYFIDGRFFYPGDGWHDPQRPVEILALPVAGPWARIADALDYAKQMAPKKCFPVHDAMIKENARKPIRALPQKALSPIGIEFIPLEEGEETTL